MRSGRNVRAAIGVHGTIAQRSGPTTRPGPALVRTRPAVLTNRKSKPVAIIKIAQFWPNLKRANAGKSTAPAGGFHVADGLDAFAPEPLSAGAAVSAATTTAPAVTGAWFRPSAAILRLVGVVLLSGGLAAAGTWAWQRRALAPATASALTIETTSPGVEVLIGGRPAGRTPLTLQMPAGAYDVQLGSGASQRVLHVVLEPGVSVVQRVEMPQVIAAADLVGALHVQTEPARLPVSVDGIPKGMSPLTIEALTPGEHEVSIRTDTGVLRRTVTVQQNQTVSLIVSPLAQPVPSAGWLAVASSVPLQLREGGKVIGTTDLDRVMLPLGEHDIEMVNEALGYRVQRKVSVAAGKTTTVRADLPAGTLSINALPWAEVWIDGKRIGETPIGNMAVTIGTREVVFRHPELGERQESVVVGLRQPARLGVDLRRK